MKEYAKVLSIIVPCYNEEESVPLFYEETIKQEAFFHAKDVEFEFIFVNDGSRDGTVAAVRALHERDARVHLVSFSRNFGKESAIIAGLEKATGDFTVLMDADLQDPPAILPEMYGYIEEGYDSVATRRVDRKGEPPIRSFFARRFYGLMKEYNRFSKGIFGWVGYDTKWIEYENVQRAAGETKWSFWKLFLYSLDGIMAFSTAPLSIASFFGIIFCVMAFVFMAFIFIRAMIYGDPVAGWPSTVCIISLIGGVQLLCIGIMGQYMSKMYMEVKDRPKYLVKDEF